VTYEEVLEFDPEDDIDDVDFTVNTEIEEEVEEKDQDGFAEGDEGCGTKVEARHCES